MASQLFDHQQLSIVLREQTYRFLKNLKRLAPLRKPILGALALAAVSFMVIGTLATGTFHGWGPGEQEQKQIARRAVERTLKEAERSTEVQNLVSAVRTQDTLAQSTRAMAKNYESDDRPGGFLELARGLGNAAGAQFARDQTQQFARLKNVYYAKLQIARRRIAWDRMTIQEQAYVRTHEPEFARWLEDAEIPKLLAEGKLLQGSPR